MSLNEEDLFDDLAFDEAEGAADAFDEFDAADEYDEFDEFEEMDEFDEFDEGEEFDEFDEFEEFDEEDYGDEADEMTAIVARALSAEDTDEFFRRILRGVRSAARGIGRFAQRAAPVVGRVARAASPILSMIPHPAAQAAGRVASVMGRLMADGADEEEALEAMAEVAARNPRALPIVAGLAVRSVTRGAAQNMPLRARQQMVRQATGAARTLVNRQGPAAARALPRIARSVRRTAATRGTPPAARTRVLQRTAQRVAASPQMARRLARPNPRGRQALQRAGVTPAGRPTAAGPIRAVGGMMRRGRGRSIVIRGPARIVVRP